MATAAQRQPSSDLERALLEAARAGATVDAGQALYSSDPSVRAELLIELLLGNCDPAKPRAVRLRGARITGELNLEAATLVCPLVLVQCSFENQITLNEASAPSIGLSGSQVARVLARQVVIKGSLALDGGFTATAGVDVKGGQIGGDFDCSGGYFANSTGAALEADGLDVDRSMLCGEGFRAQGEVSLIGAHIGNQFDCENGQFSHPGASAITADGLTVDQDMVCRNGFRAEGEVRLVGAHIGGQFDCAAGHFSNKGMTAIHGDGLAVDQDLFFRHGFEAVGEVRLVGAHVGGEFSCERGHFANPGGDSLNGDLLTVDQRMLCNEVAAEGRFGLKGAHVAGELNCTGARVGQGGALDLTNCRAGAYVDDAASWPAVLCLDGFVYDSIDEVVPVEQRITWLERNESGYSPGIYEQLAAVYRKAGEEDDARKVLIAKQRRRRAKLNLFAKTWNVVLHWTVGYGYRTWQAALWLIGLLVVGSFLFNSFFPEHFMAAHANGEQPPFQNWLYTLDLLLPVITLHQRDAWIPLGPAQWWALVWTLAGWILTSAVVLSLTGILRRE